jgi:hypothetical protein
MGIEGSLGRGTSVRATSLTLLSTRDATSTSWAALGAHHAQSGDKEVGLRD